MTKKHKILALCDHPLSSSGVGVQARHLFDGLLATGKYSFRVFGGAVKHANYDTVVVSDDYIIKPIDGFGDRNMLRVALATEKPDALFLFTDPRFFLWVWEMEEEIHQLCPIAYWHVWDNRPAPIFNEVLYRSTDLINCHSYLTYEMLGEIVPDMLDTGMLNFIPHALPPKLFKPIDDVEKLRQLKQQQLGPERLDHFVCLWINRNAKRKRPNDVLQAWKLFLDRLEATYGHRKATLLMHTDPADIQGSNLFRTTEMLDIVQNVVFSCERFDFEHICVLHNISDFCLNISYHEGFGLGTLESMQCGNPIIAVKTGGLMRQVVDHRDGSENGVGLDPEFRTLVGGQACPYIYEDYVSNETVADAIFKLYDMGPDERRCLGKKARDYVTSEFKLAKTISDWDKTLENLIADWKKDSGKMYQSWERITL